MLYVFLYRSNHWPYLLIIKSIELGVPVLVISLMIELTE